MEKKEIRNSNHELMRIISMFFIVINHVIYHGHVFDNNTNSTLEYILYLVMLIIIVHVNSFILLTGYYQCKKNFKQSAIWKIISASLFYKISIMIILISIGVLSLDYVAILKQLSPIQLEGYWFIKNYCLLYCLSPFLNKLINSMNKKEFRCFLLVGFVIVSIIPALTNGQTFSNNGFSLYNFIYIYFIGAYLRNYPLEEGYMFKKFSTNIFRMVLLAIIFVCAFNQLILLFFSKVFMWMNPLFYEIGTTIKNSIEIEGTGFSYSSPLIIIQSVAYFLFFTTLSFKSKFINKIATLVFGVYLIHENIYLRMFEYKWLGIDNGPIYSCRFLLNIFSIAILLYIVCLLIEFIRQIIFKYIYNRKFSKRIRDKYYDWIHGFYIKNG